MKKLKNDTTKLSIVNFSNVTININKNIILKNINFSLQKNEKVFVIGSSGAGKTTLFNAIIDNSLITKGNLSYKNVNMKNIKTKDKMKSIGFIAQKDYFLDWETVYFNIKNLYPNYKNYFYEFFNIINSKQKNKIKMIAKKLGVQNLLFKKVSEISGGERQRIKILLLLLKSPSLILADEPTSALDIKIGKDIIQLLYNIPNSSIIINIHHLNLIPEDSKRIIAIKTGKIIFDGPKNKLTKKIIKEIYE